jgi:hypothetical protein
MKKLKRKWEAQTYTQNTQYRMMQTKKDEEAQDKEREHTHTHNIECC